MDSYLKVLSSTAKVTEAPEYVKLFPRGSVSSQKGDFVVDAESFRMMKEHMEQRNIDIVIDYEHQTLGDGRAPAGGWIKELVLKADGIYAKVEWTKRAMGHLLNKEYRYLSPVVLVSRRDQKASMLHSVALTNTPAINGMTPIVNSMSVTDIKSSTSKLTEEQKHILHMLNVSEKEIQQTMRNG